MRDAMGCAGLAAAPAVPAPGGRGCGGGAGAGGEGPLRYGVGTVRSVEGRGDPIVRVAVSGHLV